VMTHRLTPLAPDHTHVECEWLFSPEAVEQEDFDPSIRQRLLGRDQPPGLDRTRGRAEGRLLARLPPGSPLPREDAFYHFSTMVANGYLADGIARPASRAPTPSTSRGFRAPA
jgi:hypothetical protein